MKSFLLSTLLISMFAIPCFSQNKGSNSTVKDANNPLASIKTFSIHNVYSPSLYALDGTSNVTWLRYAQPIGKVLIRASMPINSINSSENNHSGLGDFSIFGAYLLTQPSAANQIGIGPLLSVPTATSRFLGTGKWQAGIAFAGYFASNSIFQCGILATWQHSFAGNDNRDIVHAASIQPFLMWQLGKGIYLRNTAITILDFKQKNYLIPIGLGAGKIIKINNVVCNIFAEPQFAVWGKGSGLPKTQIFIGFNTQF